MPRSSQIAYAVIVIAVGLTVFSGVLEGRWNNRWGKEKLEKAGLGFTEQELPEEVGPWQLRRLSEKEAVALEIKPEVLKELQCVGNYSTSYINTETSDVVNVSIYCGPSGPISVHSPEICYSARAHRLLRKRENITIDDSNGEKHNLWSVAFEPNTGSLEKNTLIVYYGWTTNGTWSATESPRFSYIGEPVLYKVQAACSVVGAESEVPDPLQDFFKHFLPAVKERLFRAR